jgi:hypothetical protein
MENIVDRLRNAGVVKGEIADSQYSSAKLRKTVENYGVKPIIPYPLN